MARVVDAPSRRRRRAAGRRRSTSSVASAPATRVTRPSRASARSTSAPMDVLAAEHVDPRRLCARIASCVTSGSDVARRVEDRRCRRGPPSRRRSSRCSGRSDARDDDACATGWPAALRREGVDRPRGLLRRRAGHVDRACRPDGRGTSPDPDDLRAARVGRPGRAQRLERGAGRLGQVVAVAEEDRRPQRRTRQGRRRRSQPSSPRRRPARRPPVRVPGYTARAIGRGRLHGVGGIDAGGVLRGASREDRAWPRRRRRRESRRRRRRRRRRRSSRRARGGRRAASSRRRTEARVEVGPMHRSPVRIGTACVVGTKTAFARAGVYCARLNAESRARRRDRGTQVVGANPRAASPRSAGPFCASPSANPVGPRKRWLHDVRARALLTMTFVFAGDRRVRERRDGAGHRHERRRRLRRHRHRRHPRAAQTPPPRLRRPARSAPHPPHRPAPVPGAVATILPDGRAAPPVGAPLEVQKAIIAANQIIGKPYRYGGGHRRFIDRGYDCSGTVSFALNGGGLSRARSTPAASSAGARRAPGRGSPSTRSPRTRSWSSRACGWTRAPPATRPVRRARAGGPPCARRAASGPAIPKASKGLLRERLAARGALGEDRLALGQRALRRSCASRSRRRSSSSCHEQRRHLDRTAVLVDRDHRQVGAVRVLERRRSRCPPPRRARRPPSRCATRR